LTAYSSPSLDFVNLDDELGGITVAPLVGVTTETGLQAQFTVVLDGQPASDVTVNLESTDPSEGIASPTSLTFTDMNWDEPQTVTVTGVTDGKRDGNIRYWITFAPAVTDDPVYAGIKAQRVNMTNVDDADLAIVAVFDDGLPTHATLAIDTSGAWQPVFASDSASFEAALLTAEAAIVELSTLTLDPSTELALAAFVTSGGRAIISYHDLDGAPALQAALGVTAAAPHTTFRNVFQNPLTDPDFFNDFDHPLATVITGSDVVADNGHALTLTGAGTMPGRFDSATGAGAIAVTHEGRVIVNGFAPEDADSTDVDGDSRPDVLELYENQIAYLARASVLRIDVNTAVEILDQATVESAVLTSGLLEGVSKVRVSFHITHTDVTDLDMLLIAPDGTAIDIASDRGSVSGVDNYGFSCDDADRVTLDDDAALVLSTLSADAPYAGSWKPEQAFVNLQGLNPNGTWTLSVTDDGPNDIGFVECWSLFLE
jgi:subtilisin-like proprotein convertase family protein